MGWSGSVTQHNCLYTHSYMFTQLMNSNKLDQSKDQRNYKQIILSIAVL